MKQEQRWSSSGVRWRDEGSSVAVRVAAYTLPLLILSISDLFHQGGKSTLENCQVLQATVNRSKGNRTEISKEDLIQKSSYCRVSGRDMDLLELSAYGNVR
ncbi:unnamed protein product [Camellia sinensis]